MGVDSYAAIAHASAKVLPAPPGKEPHRKKATRPELPLWCALVTRVIKAGTEEFKSAPCMAAQVEEKRKLDAQTTWDYDTVREWAHVRSDVSLPEATVARLFVIMGRKGDEITDESGRSSEVKYKARGV